MTVPGGTLVYVSRRGSPSAIAEAGLAGFRRGEAALGSGARPGWPGVRPAANDGPSREVPVITESARLISGKIGCDFPGFSRVARGGVSCPS